MDRRSASNRSCYQGDDGRYVYAGPDQGYGEHRLEQTPPEKPSAATVEVQHHIGEDY